MLHAEASRGPSSSIALNSRATGFPPWVLFELLIFKRIAEHSSLRGATMTLSSEASASKAVDRAEASELFREWRVHNKPGSLREQSLGMLACMTAMMPLDYLLFPPALAPWCTLLRVISMVFAVAGLTIAGKLGKRPVWSLTSRRGMNWPLGAGACVHALNQALSK